MTIYVTAEFDLRDAMSSEIVYKVYGNFALVKAYVNKHTQANVAYLYYHRDARVVWPFAAPIFAPNHCIKRGFFSPLCLRRDEMHFLERFVHRLMANVWICRPIFLCIRPQSNIVCFRGYGLVFYSAFTGAGRNMV